VVALQVEVAAEVMPAAGFTALQTQGLAEMRPEEMEMQGLLVMLELPEEHPLV
jgi:hypothetical protein